MTTSPHVQSVQKDRLLPAAARGDRSAIDHAMSLGTNVGAKVPVEGSAVGLGICRPSPEGMAAIGKKNENAKLLLAMAHGDWVAFDQALAAGADPDTRDGGGGRSACALAAAKSDPRYLDALIAAGAEVDGRDSRGETAAMAAVERGNLACLRVLIAAGADIQASDAQGYTVLMHAAGFGQEECLRTLLEAGADIDALNCAGRDAAGVAARNEQPAIARLLKVVALAYAEQIELAGGYGHSRSNDAGGLELAGRKRASRL